MISKGHVIGHESVGEGFKKFIVARRETVKNGTYRGWPFRE